MKHSTRAIAQPLLFTLILVALPALAEDQTDFKMVPLHEFMKGEVDGRYPISIPVPKEYEPFEQDAVDASYWMLPSEFESVLRTGSLPFETGHIYGKVTASVAYDREKDLFVGVEDVESLRKLREVFKEAQPERFQLGEHAALLTILKPEGSKSVIYTLYFATLIDSFVVYVAYIPPNGDTVTGDYAWKALRDQMMPASEKSAASP